jgi:hypothetical protein
MAVQMSEHQRDRVTPYFDLFDRLDDQEIARLAKVEPSVVTEIRPILDSIVQPLGDYDHLLDSLGDSKLSRAFGLPDTAVRIWRLCRAPHTLTAAERNAEGALDEIMGPADSDIMLIIEDVPDEPPAAQSATDMDWSDL